MYKQFALFFVIFFATLVAALPVVAQTVDDDEEAMAEQALIDTAGLQMIDDLVTIDMVVLKYDDTRSVVQVNALVNRDKLDIKPGQKKGVEANYEICFSLYQYDQLLAQDHWKRSDWSKSLEKRKGNVRIPETARYGLAPGEFHVKVCVVDMIGRRYDVEEMKRYVRYFTNVDLATSDIIFSSHIDPRGGSEEFDINGTQVVPDADPIFGDGREATKWYAEIYNLRIERGAQHTVTPTVIDSAGNPAIELPVISSRTHDSDINAWGDLDFSTLSPGKYEFVLTVADLVTGDSVVTKRPFEIQRLELPVEQIDLTIAGVDPDSTSDEEIEVEFGAIQYFLKDSQKRLMSRVYDVGKKRALLAHLYQALDPDTTTATNEFRAMFLERLEHVSESFGLIMGRPGWKRERGRIYIVYGKPSSIEYFAASPEVVHAYEIWDYETIQGGIIFVFVDRNDLGLYSLVHSTARNELSNPGWEAREVKATIDDGTSDSFTPYGAGIGR